MGEIPQQPRNDGQVMKSQQKELAPGNEDLFNQIFHSGGAKKTGQYSNISSGQIESMRVPDGWVKREGVRLPAGAGLTEFHPSGQDDTRLNSYYRGSKIDPESARIFKGCLAKRPHSLSMEELSSLSQVVRDKAYDFKLRAAKTEDLNGKRVLSIEGEYNDNGHTGSQTLYIDSDGTGTAVQEISYTATGQNYKTNLEQAQKAFKSIIWKP